MLGRVAEFQRAGVERASDARRDGRARREGAAGTKRVPAQASTLRGGDARDSFGTQLYGALLRPVDAAWLGAFRAAFGVVLCISMIRFLAYGWVYRFFVTPRFHFKYWGFSWIEPLSASGMHAVFVGLAVAAFMVAVGCCYRISAGLLALGLIYVQLIDVTTYLNHYYLAALLALLLSVSPAHRVGSVDRWLRARLGFREFDSSVPAGVLYLFRFQVGLVYVFAGLAKAQPDWLVHAQPLRIWLGASVDLPVLGALLTVPSMPLAMSWAGFLFDTTIVGWSLWSRTRPAAYLVLIAFHVMTRVLFPIGMFPAIMTLAALVFFSPNWPRRLVAKLVRRPLPAHEFAPVSARRLPGRFKFAIAAGAAYCVVQLALPLRSHAYGGNVLWHEQGMRFSWRVMLRAKGGSTTFVVSDRTTGRTFHVSPSQYLTDLQESEMSSQPDLILQIAHHIQRDLESRGYGPLEVRADARASLNGRPSVRLIDPGVDLTQVQDGIGRAEWILPEPASPPPHTKLVR